MNDRINLLAAIAKARPAAEAPGIYAQRSLTGAWAVAFGFYADFMVRISDDDDARAMDDCAIANMILGCWEAEWDAD
jgi:hypothetical protein